MSERRGPYVLRREAWVPDPVAALLRHDPKSHLGKLVRAACRYLPTDQAADLLDSLLASVVMESSLHGRVFRADGRVEDLGLLDYHLVTTAGVNYIVTWMTGAVTGANMKYHALGTGTTAAAVGDTALQTEIPNASYQVSGTRATGTAVAGSSANIFQSVGTNTVQAAVANTEYGIMSQAATGGGTLLDHFVYSVVNLASGDSMQGTFNLTFPSGG